MTKALPFTEASLARAIKGVERSGKFVIGVRVNDGVLLVAQVPLDPSSLIPIPTDEQNAPVQKRRMGDYFNDARIDPASKWGDERAVEHNSAPPIPKQRFGRRPSGAIAKSEELATPPRADDKPRRRRGGGWGFAITVDDPKVIESYRAAGVEVYEDGEREELIKHSPMGKRETAALGGFFRARSELADVKGAGLQITHRLITRGYIEIAESHGNDRKYRITPAGEAEWLRLSNDSSR